MTPDSRQRIWFAVFVLTVFCTGLASGVFIGRRMTPALPFPPFFGAFAPGMVPPGSLMLDRLTEALQLNPDQRQQLDAVLKASRDHVMAQQQDVRTRFEADQRRLRDEIRAILTPDQQVRFERWLEQAPRGRGFGRGRGGPE
jgi:Spy/CpxP family protein refolding chaperone